MNAKTNPLGPGTRNFAINDAAGAVAAIGQWASARGMSTGAAVKMLFTKGAEVVDSNLASAIKDARTIKALLLMCVFSLGLIQGADEFRARNNRRGRRDEIVEVSA